MQIVLGLLLKDTCLLKYTPHMECFEGVYIYIYMLFSMPRISLCKAIMITCSLFADKLFWFKPILQLRNYRLMGLVMAIKADKVSTFRKELHSLIGEP